MQNAADGVGVTISEFDENEEPNLDYWGDDIDSIVAGFDRGTNSRGRFLRKKTGNIYAFTATIS